jgi:ABC-type sugar transport system permease subunit
MSGIKRYPIAWLLPALLPVAFITIYPIAHALWTSLHQVMILFPVEPFVGLDNYRRVVSSDYFADALKNSLLFTASAAPAVVILGLAIALFLQRRFFGSEVIRSIVLLPWVLPGAISAVLWVWVFHPSFGVLNGLLMSLGLIDQAIPWLTSPRLALYAVVVAHIWTQVPFAVVLIMAALSAIN